MSEKKESGFNLRVIPGQFNDISEELKELVKPLKPGQTKIYRMPVPVEQDHIVDKAGVKPLKNKLTGGFTWPQSMLIPTVDEIQDVDGQLKKIAVIRDYNNNSKEMISWPLFINSYDDGFIIVEANRLNTSRFYAFLELTDFNGSKKNRDTSKPILFYEINPSQELAVKAKKVDLMTEELQYVRDLPKSDVLVFAQGLLWDTSGIDIEDLRDNLKIFVSENPGKITEIHSNKQMIINKSIIKQALDARIILFNEPENKYTFQATGKVIATFSRMENKETIDQLSEWLSTHKDGENVKEAIKNFLKYSSLQES